MSQIRSSFTRRNVVALVVVDVALFFIANMTAKNAHHPGTVSNVAWGAFLLGTAVLLVSGVAAVALRSQRATG